jgi:phosphohistidine phosphatase
MDLFVLRHAIAVDREEHRGKDEDRPLTQQGRKKMRRIARGMRRLGLRFDVIVSSPLLRARQTADIVARELSSMKKLRLSPELAAGNDPTALLSVLGKRNRHRVLLVGHEPQLSVFISIILTGSNALSVTMKKGGLCKLSVDGFPRPRSATLEWLLTPSQLASLS